MSGFVQGAADGVVKFNGDTLALPGNATAGNHVLVFASHSYTGCPVTIQDDQENEYTRHVFAADGLYTRYSVFSALVANSAPLEVVFNMACGQSARVAIVEVNGLDTPHFDQWNRNLNTSSPSNAGEVTPTTDEQYIAVWAVRGTTGSWTADSPFTKQLESGSSYLAYEDYIQPTAGAITPSMLTSADGSFPVDMLVATFKMAAAGVTVEPSAAALTLSGETPTVSVSDNKSVSPSTAALTLAGATPSVGATAHVTVQPSAGTLALTGSAPSLDLAFAPAAGSLSLTAETPTVAVSDHVTVTPSSAALTLAGASPSLDLAIAPAVAVLTLTTETPTVEATDHVTVSPAAGALVLTAETPDVQAGGNVSVTPATAALAVSGATPTVSVTEHVTVSPAAATLTLSGAAPSLILTLSPSAALLVLSGATPSVSVAGDVTVGPAPGGLTLVTFAPSLDTAVSPTPGALVLTGLVPVVTSAATQDPLDIIELDMIFTRSAAFDLTFTQSIAVGVAV